MSATDDDLRAIDVCIKQVKDAATAAGMTYSEKKNFFSGARGSKTLNARMKLLLDERARVSAGRGNKNTPRASRITTEWNVQDFMLELVFDAPPMPKKKNKAPKRQYTRSDETKADDKLYALGVSANARKEILLAYTPNLVLKVQLPAVDNVDVRVKDLKDLLAASSKEQRLSNLDATTFQDTAPWDLLWQSGDWASMYEGFGRDHARAIDQEAHSKGEIHHELTVAHRNFFTFYWDQTDSPLGLLQKYCDRDLRQDRVVTREEARTLLGDALGVHYDDFWVEFEAAAPEEFVLSNFPLHFMEALFATRTAQRVYLAIKILNAEKQYGPVGFDIHSFSRFAYVVSHSEGGRAFKQNFDLAETRRMYQFVDHLLTAYAQVHYMTRGCFERMTKGNLCMVIN